MYAGLIKYPSSSRIEELVIATSGQTTVTGLNFNPTSYDVYINGVKFYGDEISSGSGTSITFASPLLAGDKVQVVSNDDLVSGAVFSVAGKTGVVNLVVSDVSGAAPKESPIFTGNPTAPTPLVGDNDTSLATTAFVTTAISNAISGITFTLDPDLVAIGNLTTTGFLKRTGPDTWALDNNTYLTSNQSITLTGDVSGNGTTSISTTLANSGVTAGTYNNSATQHNALTVDAKGRVTSAGPAMTITPAFSSITNTPTTLAGYGITDGYGLGMGQSWQNLSGSRSAGVTYTNSTQKPIMWMAIVQATAGGTYVTTRVNGTTMSTHGPIASGDFVGNWFGYWGSSGTFSTILKLPIVIPPGQTYGFGITGGSAVVEDWYELR